MRDIALRGDKLKLNYKKEIQVTRVRRSASDCPISWHFMHFAKIEDILLKPESEAERITGFLDD